MSTETSLLEQFADDNPKVVYTARCSTTGASRDNFMIGGHFVEHEAVNEEAWREFNALWGDTIMSARAEIKYDFDGELYDAMHEHGSYPRMDDHLRILDFGNVKVDVKVVGTYLYLTIITSTDEPKPIAMARSWNKVRARELAQGIKAYHGKYYRKERIDLLDGDYHYEYHPRPILECPHCSDLLIDEMHIMTCLDDAYEALGINRYL